ncbi:MAG TPA: hypothetical protein VFC23_17375 [Thermoanaerobaculia bacterium]|nr:hypothetical protein [Thermoanaerobaculia bacterium]
MTVERTFAPAGALGRAEVASGGSFRFPNLQPGTYEVYVLEPDLPSDSFVRHPPQPEGEEIFFDDEDSYESIDQKKVELKANREITFDVRASRNDP